MAKNTTNNAKSYAEEGLEEIQDQVNEAVTSETFHNTSESSGGEEEFVQVGGLDPVDFYLRTTPPKKPAKTAWKIFEKGQTIIGTYDKSFVSGKYQNQTFLIRLSEGPDTGKLAGIAGTGSLTKAMNKLEEGSKVKITYTGMQAIKNGKWEGNDAHTFVVFGSKLKS